MTVDLVREETSTIGPERELPTELADRLSQEGLGTLFTGLSLSTLALPLLFLLLFAIDNGGRET